MCIFYIVPTTIYFWDTEKYTIYCQEPIVSGRFTKGKFILGQEQDKGGFQKTPMMITTKVLPWIQVRRKGLQRSPWWLGPYPKVLAR